MLDERDEYLLSRYADGDLSESERARAEVMLRSNPEAVAVLRQYRQLNGLLRLSRELPPVDFEAMHEAINAGIDAPRHVVIEQPEFEEEIEPARSVSFWRSRGMVTFQRRLVVAASLTLACGLAWQMYRASSVPPVASPGAPDSALEHLASSGPMSVSGPLAEAPRGPASITIGIGPSAEAARLPAGQLYESELRTGPGRVRLTGGSEPAKTKDDKLPF